MNDLRRVIACIESEGYTVMNWKPGNRRIFKVLRSGEEVSTGMYSSELRAWYKGWCEAEGL